MKWHDPIWIWADASHITHAGNGPAGYGYVIRWNSREFYVGAGPLQPTLQTNLIELQSILAGLRAVNNVMLRKGQTDRMILVHNDNTEIGKAIISNNVSKYREACQELNTYIGTFAYRIGFVYHRKYHYKENKLHHLSHVLAMSAAKRGLQLSQKLDRLPRSPYRWIWLRELEHERRSGNDCDARSGKGKA